MKLKIIVPSVVGVIGLLFGVIWLVMVFPSFKKIPSDYEQTIDFKGTYSVLSDQEFLISLFTNPSVGKALASPQTLRLLSQSDTKQLLANDAFQKLLANPVVLQAILTNPAAALQAPDSVKALLADPVIQTLLVDASKRQFLQSLLSDPGIMGLLADPAAVRLLTDVRALRLLANPTKPALQDIPIAFHRVRVAEREGEGLVFLHQDFNASLSTSGQSLPQFSTTSTLAVDRETRLYASGGSEPRRGAFAFPFDVKKDGEYQIWITEVFQPLTARFESAETIDGLTVYKFRIKEADLPLPDAVKKSQGLPGSLDMLASVDVVLKTEPKSGVTVDLQSDIRYSLKNPILNNPTLFTGAIQYTEESVSTSVDDAKDIKGMLFWFGIVLPWVSIGLGILSLLSSIVIWVRSTRKQPASSS